MFIDNILIILYIVPYSVRKAIMFLPGRGQVIGLKAEEREGAMHLKRTEFAIAAHGVRKKYAGAKNRAALNGFDLEVRPGSVCGLLGPNGRVRPQL